MRGQNPIKFLEPADAARRRVDVDPLLPGDERCPWHRQRRSWEELHVSCALDTYRKRQWISDTTCGRIEAGGDPHRADSASEISGSERERWIDGDDYRAVGAQLV